MEERNAESQAHGTEEANAVPSLSALLSQKMKQLERHRAKEAGALSAAAAAGGLKVQEPPYGQKAAPVDHEQAEQATGYPGSSRTAGDDQQTNSNSEMRSPGHYQSGDLDLPGRSPAQQQHENLQTFLYNQHEKRDLALDEHEQVQINIGIQKLTDDEGKLTQVYSSSDAAQVKEQNNFRKATRAALDNKKLSWNIDDIVSAYEEEIISQHQNKKQKEVGDQSKLGGEERQKDAAAGQWTGQWAKERQAHQDPRQIITLMNDPGDDGEDRGEEDELPHKTGDEQSSGDENTYNFFELDKGSGTPEAVHEIREGGMWSNEMDQCQEPTTPADQEAHHEEEAKNDADQFLGLHAQGDLRGPERMRRQSQHELQDDGEDQPSCQGEGEEYDEPINAERKSEREDTEIDFIQQVDTDRQANQEQDGDLYLPVNSENQIQIKSKHQGDINDQILGKQQAQLRELQQKAAQPGQRASSKSLTLQDNNRQKSSLNHAEVLYTEVYVWGSDACGQLGLELHGAAREGARLSYYPAPKSCSFNVLVKQIACGAHHTAMLTQTGHLYMMGQNNFGQLGIGSKEFGPRAGRGLQQPSEFDEPGKSEFQGTFNKGSEPEMPGTEDSQLLVCHSKNVRAPCLVEALKHTPIKKVACGSNFTMALACSQQGGKASQKSKSMSGCLYAWGDNSFGQLGLVGTATVAEPLEAGAGGERRHKKGTSSLSDIVRNSSYQSKLSSTIVNEPHKVPEVGGARYVDFSCGENFTIIKAQGKGLLQSSGNQGLAGDLPAEGVHFYACGLNSAGQCGQPVVPVHDCQGPLQESNQALRSLTRILLPDALQRGVSQFEAGVEHALFLCSQTGTVFQCGGSRLSHSQSLFNPVMISEPVRLIKASLYSAALSVNNTLYIWSSQDSFNPSYSIRHVRDLALSKSFAVLVGEKDKAYMWGAVTPSEEVGVRPFYQEFAPSETITKNLKNKAIRSVACGADFVFALGKDVKAREKAEKKQVAKVAEPVKRRGSVTKTKVGEPVQRSRVAQKGKVMLAPGPTEQQVARLDGGIHALAQHDPYFRVQPNSRDLMPSAPARQPCRSRSRGMPGSTNKLLSEQALNVLKRSIGTSSTLPQQAFGRKKASAASKGQGRKTETHRNHQSISPRCFSAQPTLAKRRRERSRRQAEEQEVTTALSAAQASVVSHYMDRLNHELGQADLRMSHAHSRINGILQKQAKNAKELSKRQIDGFKQPASRPKHIISAKPKKKHSLQHTKVSQPLHGRAEHHALSRASASRLAKDLARSFASEVSGPSQPRGRATAAKSAQSLHHAQAFCSSEVRHRMSQLGTEVSGTEVSRNALDAHVRSQEPTGCQNHQQQAMLIQNEHALSPGLATGVATPAPGEKIVNVRIPTMHGHGPGPALELSTQVLQSSLAHPGTVPVEAASQQIFDQSLVLPARQSAGATKQAQTSLSPRQLELPRARHAPAASYSGTTATRAAASPERLLSASHSRAATRDLKLQLKQYQNDIVFLFDDIQKKETEIARLKTALERARREQPRSPRSTGRTELARRGSKAGPAEAPGVERAARLQLELCKKDQEIERLKAKVERSAHQLKEVSELMSQKQREGPKDTKEAMGKATPSKQKLPATARSEDLFVATEQICRLQGIIQQQKEEIAIKGRLFAAREEDLRDAEEKVREYRQQAKVSQTKQLQAEREVEELQGGVLEFQEQAQVIQADLIAKIHELQGKYAREQEHAAQLQYQVSDLTAELQRQSLSTREAPPQQPPLASDSKELYRLQRELQRRGKREGDLERENEELREMLEKLNGKLEKRTFNDLLSRVGVSRSRGRGTPVKDDVSKEAAIEQHSQERGRSPVKLENQKVLIHDAMKLFEPRATHPKTKSLEQLCEMTIGSRISKRSLERAAPQKAVKETPKYTTKYLRSDLKGLITDKLNQRAVESQSRSIERSYERYQQPGAGGASASGTADKDRRGYYDQVEDPAEHSFLSRLGENNREVISILHHANPPKSYFNEGNIYADSQPRHMPETLSHRSPEPLSLQHREQQPRSQDPRSHYSQRGGTGSAYEQRMDQTLTTNNERGAAVAVEAPTIDRTDQLSFNRRSVERNERAYLEEGQADQVKSLRLKYNERMKQSLERKAELEYRRRDH